MSDGHLPPPTSGERILQLTLFELLDPQDSAYSQAIELYDLIPKYIRYRRQREFHPSNLMIHQSFAIRGREYALRIHGAIIKDRDGDAHIVYPGTREELIEDALRKITVSQARAVYDHDGGFCKFTIYELQQELKSMGHCYSNTEIKESLNILHQTRIEVDTDGKKVTSGYLLPSLSLASEEDLRLDHDAKCVVRFHEIVSISIKRLEFRNFNYAMTMSFRSSLARYFFKRLSHRWLGASMINDFGPIGLMGLLRDAGENRASKMFNNQDKIQKALDEFIEKGVIRGYQEKPIKVGRRIVDVQYTLQAAGRYVDQPNTGFVSDMKRANHFVRRQCEMQATRAARRQANCG